jgi:hypothetical protein
MAPGAASILRRERSGVRTRGTDEGGDCTCQASLIDAVRWHGPPASCAGRTGTGLDHGEPTQSSAGAKAGRKRDDPFQRLLGTVRLTRKEWIVFILAALTVYAASEMWQLVLRRRSLKIAAEQELPEAPAVPTAS